MVASEVKELAEESKKATKHVRQIIREIQEATNSTVLSTEQGTKSVNEAREVVAKAGKTIEALALALAETPQAAAKSSLLPTSRPRE